MFEINYEMTTRFDNQVDEVLCCSCYYDEVYFLLRQKVMKFLKKSLKDMMIVL